MLFEIVVIGMFVTIIFFDYFKARAKLIHEQARALEIENDRRELE